MRKLILAICAMGISLTAAFCQTGNANEKVFVVEAGQIKAQVQPTMYGIFFEDINQAADGGVYAELVKNRSFEFKMPLMGWKEIKQDGADGSILVLNRGKADVDNPRYIHVTAKSTKGYGLNNEGFHGMGV